MSKKMWHNIFKSKSQKAQLKLNRRHSRGFYEEYQQQQQQQSELPNGEKSKGVSNENDNISAYGSGNGDVNGSRNGNGNENKNKNGNNEQINVFEQQPLQSSFNSATLNEAQQLHAQQTLQHQQQQQHQHLSTFSRVRNTLFSKKRVRCAKSSESIARPRAHTHTNFDCFDCCDIRVYRYGRCSSHSHRHNNRNAAAAATTNNVTYHLHANRNT